MGLEEGIHDLYELDDDYEFTRSIHILPDGALITYDRHHEADEFGQLPEGPITEENLADKRFGTTVPIPKSDFEVMWNKKAKNRE